MFARSYLCLPLLIILGRSYRNPPAISERDNPPAPQFLLWLPAPWPARRSRAAASPSGRQSGRLLNTSAALAGACASSLITVNSISSAHPPKIASANMLTCWLRSCAATAPITMHRRVDCFALRTQSAFAFICSSPRKRQPPRFATLNPSRQADCFASRLAQVIQSLNSTKRTASLSALFSREPPPTVSLLHITHKNQHPQYRDSCYAIHRSRLKCFRRPFPVSGVDD